MLLIALRLWPFFCLAVACFTNLLGESLLVVELVTEPCGVHAASWTCKSP